MATTNIHLIKTLDGRTVKYSDIHVGLEVYYPAGVGGVITHVCTRIEGNVASFKGTRTDWPTSFTVEDGVDDFTDNDFRILAGAIRAINSPNKIATPIEIRVFRRAIQLGYASPSAVWTDRGIAHKKQLSEVETADLLQA